MEKKIEYASIHRRFLAATIDLIVVSLFLGLLSEITARWFAIDNSNMAEMISKQLADQGDKLTFSSFFWQTTGYLSAQHLWWRVLAMQLFGFFCVACYNILFWVWRGATIGKMILQIQIVDNASVGPLTKKQAIKRFLAYILSALPVGLGFIAIDYQKQKRAWHDLLAGTAVIVRAS